MDPKEQPEGRTGHSFKVEDILVDLGQKGMTEEI